MVISISGIRDRLYYKSGTNFDTITPDDCMAMFGQGAYGLEWALEARLQQKKRKFNGYTEMCRILVVSRKNRVTSVIQDFTSIAILLRRRPVRLLLMDVNELTSWKCSG